MSTDVTLQSLDAPDYVDAIALIKLAQRYNIHISDKFVIADTPKKRVELRNWVYSEVRKVDPKFTPEY